MARAATTGAITIEMPTKLFVGIAATPGGIADALRLAAAIEWYREGRIPQGRVAEVAGVSRADFLEALYKAKVPACQGDVAELMEEVEHAITAGRGRVPTDPAGEDESA